MMISSVCAENGGVGMGSESLYIVWRLEKNSAACMLEMRMGVMRLTAMIIVFLFS